MSSLTQRQKKPHEKIMEEETYIAMPLLISSVAK